MDRESAQTCPICAELYNREHNPPLTLNPCGHPICKPCWHQWRTSHNRVSTCPHCRIPVHSETINRGLLDMIECTGNNNNNKNNNNDNSNNNDASSGTATQRLYPDLPDDEARHGRASIVKRLHGKSNKRKHLEFLHDRCEAGFYVLDNSGSMQTVDGKVFIHSQSNPNEVTKKTYLTRWGELQCKTIQIAEYNIKRGFKAAYYLLNPSQREVWVEDVDYVIIDPHDVSCSTKFAQLKSKILLDSNIRGSTPLDAVTQYFVRHLKDLIDTMEYQQYPICYTLITDGEPNNKPSFERALKNLVAKFHVFLCVNMCTDNDSIIGYYNDLDQTLGSELSGMDVIDDFEAEQKEISATGNDFFVYTLDMHICRMAGCYSVMSDLLDEKPLPKHYVASLCKELIFNGSGSDMISQNVPHYSERDAFVEYVNQNNRKVYDFSRRQMRPMIDTSSLAWMLGSKNPQVWITEILKRTKLLFKLVAFLFVVVYFLSSWNRTTSHSGSSYNNGYSYSDGYSQSQGSYSSQGQGQGQGQYRSNRR